MDVTNTIEYRLAALKSFLTENLKQVEDSFTVGGKIDMSTMTQAELQALVDAEGAVEDVNFVIQAIKNPEGGRDENARPE